MQAIGTHGWMAIVLKLKPTSRLSMYFSQLYSTNATWTKVAEGVACLAESTECCAFFHHV